MKKTEYVILVDENDQTIGQEEKISAHEQALRHRAFSVFIYRRHQDQIEILLQKRADKKYHCGGLWTNTCCGHPRPEETTIEAGERRLHEEMGFLAKLTEVGMFHYIAPFDNGLTENEIDHVLAGELGDSTINMNPEEASDYRWIAATELQKEITLKPERFTPWLDKALAVFLQRPA
jgi:isopentenyl-diphosphate Delta-isomerase